MKKQILQKGLEKLGFSRLESEIYLAVLELGESNGSRVARHLGLSRSSVYSALRQMAHQGIVLSVPGQTDLYKAEDPIRLIEGMKQRFTRSASLLMEELPRLTTTSRNDSFVNLKGKEILVERVKNMIESASREILISTCIDLHPWQKELQEAESRGIRIIVFTFDPLDFNNLPIKLYYHPIPPSDKEDEDRLMIVSDMAAVLIAGSIEKKDAPALFTENPLLVSLATEHIHHDIYLLGLKRKAGVEIITPDLAIGSILEAEADQKPSLAYTDPSKRKEENH